MSWLAVVMTVLAALLIGLRIGLGMALGKANASDSGGEFYLRGCLRDRDVKADLFSSGYTHITRLYRDEPFRFFNLS